MSYTKLTDFASKDALLTGNPSKLVRGTELGAEFDAIEVADALNIKPDTVTAATGKTTPVDADLLTLFDSASTFSLKKLTWANLKATIKTYFDTLYTSLGNNTSTVYTTAGTSTAYTITPSPVIAAYAIGQSFFVNFNAACGASPTLAISGVATPPNLVKENSDGTFSNLAAGDIPINHRSRITLISTTQALVEKMPQSLTSGTAVATTSGTAIDLTSIPAWVKRITVMFSSISTNGTSTPIIQLGTGGTPKTSGYVSNATGNGQEVGSTNGFIFGRADASQSITGSYVLTLMNASTNTWTGQGGFNYNGTQGFSLSGGVSLSGTLDMIRLTPLNGTDTFDAGSVNILWE